MHNRQLKKFIAVILSIVVVLGTVVSAFAADAKVLGTSNAPKTAFPDMRAESHWAYKALAYAINNNLLKGSDGKLYPERNITRAEMAALVNRVFGATEEADISKYTDINKAKDWFYSDMAKSVQMKMFGGVSATEMNPNGKLTRQDAFVVLARALKLSSDDLSALAQFSDSASIADYAKANIAAMVAAGYVNGSDGKINPLGNITREEVAQIFYNIFTEFVSEAGTVTGDKKGTVLVNVPGVTIKDANVDGDIIIGDGVGDGECTLDNVKLTGRLLVRGGGANSIKIVNGTSIGNVIVSKSASGAVRVYCEKGAVVNVLSVDDGSDEIKVEGSFNTVEVKTDAEVSLANADVATLSISAEGANVNIESGKVAQVTVAETAVGAEIATGKDSTVGLMVINADVKVDAAGIITKTEAADNVVVEGIEVGKETKPAEEKPSTGGGGGGFVPPAPSTTVAKVTSYAELTAAIANNDIDEIEITRSFEITTYTNIKKNTVVDSSVCVTTSGFGIDECTFTNNGKLIVQLDVDRLYVGRDTPSSSKLINNGTMVIDDGYVGVYGEFVCNGYLTITDRGRVIVYGKIDGGNINPVCPNNSVVIYAYEGSVINWPYNATIGILGYSDEFGRGTQDRIHDVLKSITYGSKVPVENRLQMPGLYADIYSQEGYERFADVTSKSSIYHTVRFYNCNVTIDKPISAEVVNFNNGSNVTISSTIHANQIYFSNTTALIASNSNLIGERVYITKADVTNEGAINTAQMSINDGYQFDYDTESVYTEGAITTFTNRGNVNVGNNYTYIIGDKTTVRHESGKFIAYSNIQMRLGSKLIIKTPVTKDASATDLFYVQSNSNYDIEVDSYKLADKDLKTSVDCTIAGEVDKLKSRKNIHVKDLTDLASINGYDYVYVNSDLDVAEDLTLQCALSAETVTIKSGATLTLANNNYGYYNAFQSLCIESGAKLVILDGAGLNIGTYSINSKTNEVTGTFSFDNEGTITNNGSLSFNGACEYGHPLSMTRGAINGSGRISGNPRIILSSKDDLRSVLSDDKYPDYDLLYVGDFVINEGETFPEINKSINFRNSNVVIATGTTLTVSGRAVNVRFSSTNDTDTKIYGTLKLVDNPEVVLYKSFVNDIENEGRLFIAGDTIIDGTISNNAQIVFESNSTSNLSGTIENNRNVYVGRPFTGPTPADLLIVADGKFVNNVGALLQITQDSTMTVQGGVSGAVGTLTNASGAKIEGAGKLTIDSTASYTNEGTVDTSAGLVVVDNTAK